MPKLVERKIAELEEELAIHKAVCAKFPDATVNARGTFASKKVNKEYNNAVFNSGPTWMTLYLSYIMDTEYNGKIIKTKINGKENEHYQILNVSYKTDIIQFYDYIKDLEKHKVRPDVLPEITLKILEFIRSRPDLKINVTNLDERTKKLLIFN
jgi:hypothetical protein